jgi:exopolysaccharide production protein ExoZ
LLTLAYFFLLYSGVLAPILDPAALASNLARADWEILAKSLLFIPAHSPLSPYVHPVVPQGWTLNFEMMFYATFALALFLPRRLVVPALTLLYAIIIAVGLAWAEGPVARTWTSPLIFEFILGLWTGVAWRKGWDFRILYLYFLAASVPLIGIAVVHQDWPALLGGLPLLPLVLVIFLLVLSRDRRGAGLPEWRPARLVGDASYSIYLWHFIPILLLNRVSQSFPLSATITMIGVVLGGLLGGFAVYYLVERPIMRAVRAMRRARRLRREARSEAGPAHPSTDCGQTKRL